MGKKYLLFASHAYAYAIMRPLQDEIRRRGHEVAWFLEDSCPDRLRPDELRLSSVSEVKRWNPLAVFAPGNWIYPFFPGVKVCLFHGFPIWKRRTRNKPDGYFALRGWFDVYCTQGPAGTGRFRDLERQHGYFKVYETGWPKFDSFFGRSLPPEEPRSELTVLYSTTFSRGISSAWVMKDELRRLAAERPWRWIVTFHPKLIDPELHAAYKQLAADFPNVEFCPDANGIDTFRRSDVMLSDSSSIIIEYLMTGKPVVTLRNTNPGPYLIDVDSPADIPAAIERAASRPPELMREIELYANHCDPHRDGHNSARVLDAVDDFIAHHQAHMKRKPLNLWRKIKLASSLFKKYISSKF